MCERCDAVALVSKHMASLFMRASMANLGFGMLWPVEALDWAETMVKIYLFAN